MKKNKIYLKVSEDDSNTAYVYLPDHPREKKVNIVEKQIRLYDVIENYKGPDIYLDIDHKGNTIGIEILG